jgi:hypothetical protein
MPKLGKKRFPYTKEGMDDFGKAKKAAKMTKPPKAEKKGSPDFQRNPRSAFKNKPKPIAKPRGKKV